MPDIELRAFAYVSWSLWVADCPVPACRGAEHFGHAPITGAVGGLTQRGFCCARCGLTCPSVWPDNAADIWAVLQMRPLPETRSWLIGESIEDLVAENVAAGLIAPEVLHRQVIAVDGRLSEPVRQLATAGAAPTAVGAGPQFAIGGR